MKHIPHSLATLASLFLCVSQAAALTPSRTYQWSFPTGNAIGNWSFENGNDFWDETMLPGTHSCDYCSVDSHFPIWGGSGSKTGLYAGHVDAPYDVPQPFSLLSTPELILVPGKAYTLSFYHVGGPSGGVGPIVKFTSGDPSQYMYPAYGPDYVYSDLDWVLYTFSFYVPASAQTARIQLFSSEGRANPGTGFIYFDDVLLEEGWFDDAATVSHRDAIRQKTAFGDALGRSPQMQTKLPGGKMRLDAVGFDNYGRRDTTYLAFPFASTGPSLVADVLTAAKAAYNGTQSGRPDAGGHPVTRSVYAAEPTGRVTEASSPGNSWRMGGGHTVKQGHFYTGSLVPPADLAAPPACADEFACDKRVDWVQGKDGEQQATWTDLDIGTVLRSGTRYKDKVGAFVWVFNDFLYYPDGRKRTTVTPLDAQAGNQAHSQYDEFDAGGHLLSEYDPDRGLTRFWYNRDGKLRYSQDALQKPANLYAYHDYDNQGRVVGEGLQTLPAMSQAIADQDAYTQSGDGKSERIGYIYDSLATFATRTGVALANALDASVFPAAKSWGLLACKYNRNTDAKLPGTGAADQLVAEFYAYDDEGRPVVIAKYLGPVRDAANRRQAQRYAYADGDRLAEVSLLGPAGTLSSSHRYAYDELGRTRRIEDFAGNRIAEFVYFDWGPLQSVFLGGSGTASGTRIDYAYHIQNHVKEIKATQLGTNKVVFQELLGYESKVNSAGGVPGLLKSRYNGEIAQRLTKLTSELSGAGIKPVRLENYDFDDLGRMLRADGYANTNATPLDGSENVSFGSLVMAKDANFSTTVDYDLNGRITGQRTAGVAAADSARYVYNPATNGLDNFTGKLSAGVSRTGSTAGTFVYDGLGRLVKDASKNMTVAYDWSGLPVKFAIGTAGQYEYYDADGQRAAHVETQVVAGAEKRITATHSVRFGGKSAKEWRETYAADGATVSASQEIATLFGNAGHVGRAVKSGSVWSYQFYVKDHLGSIVRVVNSDGSYASQFAYGYMPYGDPKTLKSPAGVPSVSERYTGKEYDDLLRLYYFGARYYDPELGIWLSPDPAHQFLNPYAFNGGNPILYADPSGLFTIGLGLTVGWSNKHGFHIGVGVALDFREEGTGWGANASYVWNDDGTNSASLGAAARIVIYGVGISGGVGTAWNSQDGTTLTVFVGADLAMVVGVDVGTTHQWYASGRYAGSTLFADAWAGPPGLRVKGVATLNLNNGDMGWYATGSAGGVSASYRPGRGFQLDDFTTTVASENYNSKTGKWTPDWIGKGALAYVRSDKFAASKLGKPGPGEGDPESNKGLSSKWFGNPWCGTGGAGAAAGEADVGCYYHDKRYGAAGSAGAAGAFLDDQMPVILADIYLLANSFYAAFTNIPSVHETVGGLAVGIVFTVAASEKLIRNSEGAWDYKY